MNHMKRHPRDFPYGCLFVWYTVNVQQIQRILYQILGVMDLPPPWGEVSAFGADGNEGDPIQQGKFGLTKGGDTVRMHMTAPPSVYLEMNEESFRNLLTQAVDKEP